MSLASRIRAGMRASAPPGTRITPSEVESAIETAGVLQQVEPDLTDDAIIRRICDGRRIRYNPVHWQASGELQRQASGGGGGRRVSPAGAGVRRRSPEGRGYGAADDFRGREEELPLRMPRADEVDAYRGMRSQFCPPDIDTQEGKVCICCSGCIPLVLLIVLWASVTVVPVGSVGILSVFGSLTQNPLPSGWHFVTPAVSKVTMMTTRLQVTTFSDKVPTSEGLNVLFEARGLYRINITQAVTIYREVGINYDQKIIQPQFAAIVRDVTSGFASTDLYNAARREAIVRDIQDRLAPLLWDRGIIVEDTLVNKLLLPTAVEAAIERKMVALQQAEQMRYTLEKERKQAQQKVIKAMGLANFARIIAGGISERMLLWAGINATTSLAESNCNPKLVLVGATRGANATAAGPG